jgi:hypothetical protein
MTKIHPTETWLIGTLGARLKHCTDEAFRLDILSTIKHQCSLLNELLRLAQKAVQYLIERIMIEDRPSMHLLGDLLHISKGDGGISFWERLLNFLNRRKEKQRGQVIITKLS